MRRFLAAVRTWTTHLLWAAITLFLLAFFILPWLSIQSWWPGAEWHSRAVLTSSMTPTLPAGTQVLFEYVDEDDLHRVRLGDVIAFMPREKDSTLVMHRVIGIESSAAGGVTFTTQGDALDQPDDPVESQMVRGIQRYHVPYAGHLTTALNGHLDFRDRKHIAYGLAALIVLSMPVMAVRDRRRRRSHLAETAEAVDAGEAQVEDDAVTDASEDTDTTSENTMPAAVGGRTAQ